MDINTFSGQNVIYERTCTKNVLLFCCTNALCDYVYKYLTRHHLKLFSSNTLVEHKAFVPVMV